MISRKTFYEAGKFSIVGIANTIIDFGSLNLMSFIFGINSGLGIIVLNSIALSFAVINSYFLNKFWTFKKGKIFISREILLFIFINIISGIINTLVVYLGTTFFNHVNFTDVIWMNLVKICASIFSAGFNFLSYKFIIFKKK